MNKDREYATSGEVAKLYGVTTQTVRRWAAAGKIAVIYTPNGQSRYPKPITIEPSNRKTA